MLRKNRFSFYHKRWKAAYDFSFKMRLAFKFCIFSLFKWVLFGEPLVSPARSKGEAIVWGSTSTSIANIRRVSMKGWVGRVCRDLGLDNFHSWLNTLERFFCKRMTILVWVELFGQFAVKLGESSFRHCLHALFDEIFRSIHELIDQKYLVNLSL